MALKAAIEKKRKIPSEGEIKTKKETAVKSDTILLRVVYWKYKQPFEPNLKTSIYSLIMAAGCTLTLLCIPLKSYLTYFLVTFLIFLSLAAKSKFFLMIGKTLAFRSPFPISSLHLKWMEN